MADRIEDGGRAFPWCGDLNETPTIGLGMTLLDYFAAKALAGIMAAPGSIISPEDAGLIAYRYARGAMKARAAQ